MAAAARAGLPEPDLKELRVHLDDQFAIDAEEADGPAELPRAVIRA